GLPVTVVPGPSAVSTALAGAGISGPYAFLGFPPAAGKARKNWFETLGETTERMSVVFFEAPHRLRKTLTQARNILGVQPIMVARELTKAFEEWVERPIDEFLRGNAEPRGEFVVVVPPRMRQDSGKDAPTAASLAAEFGELTKNGDWKPKEAAKAIAAKYGLSASEVYRLAVRDADKQR